MNYEYHLVNKVKKHMPPNAKILSISMEDARGDMGKIIVMYQLDGEDYIAILENPLKEYYNNALEVNMDKKYQRNIEGLYPASVKTLRGTKWGYIRDSGKLAINPIYDNANAFQENGLAVVGLNGVFGIINRAGDYIVEPKYGFIGEFHEGRSVVIDREDFKVIDEKGRVITNKAYNYMSNYREGRAVFANADSSGKYVYGYLDLEGREVIPAKYEDASDFNDGKAVVKLREGEYALINKFGNIINTYKYAFVGNLGDGRLAFQITMGGNYGYIDINGKVVIEPKYSIALPFHEGRAIVNISQDYVNKYGVIDKRGDYIIKAEHNDIIDLGEDRYAVGKAINPEEPFMGSKYAIACVYGKFFTNFIYNSVTQYKRGIASATNDQYTFFIDRSGNVVRTLPGVRGAGTLELLNDLIKANIDYRLLYLNREGNIIWQQNEIIQLNDRYKVREEKYKPNKDYLVYYPQVMGMTNKEAEIKVNDKLKELSAVKPIDANVQLDYTYYGDFEIEFFKKNLLVLQLTGYIYHFGAAHGMPSKNYPHIDLVSGRFYELKDLFKKDSDYVKVLSDIIGEQIKNKPEYSYVFPGTYKGIRPDQPFYVDENSLYIYFEPYEIAPYAAGFPTFKIPYNEIMNIIDTNGDFWKSYH
ncbi:WG repeat-containing protein [uncultured Clostridium sp.]|uniref:WG repeat-containing protein n=1 Tax=uncultured Clostridium sp. TaxID=59620 RepID=UPI0028E1BC40|nr:WG repeat-containing protein [uncultured Clostridium sp.]